MSSPARAVRLRLHGEPVATLVERGGMDSLPVYELQFEAAYIEALLRPILSLKARDWRLDALRRFTGRMPPFLTNLLPERGGSHRRRVLAAAGLADSDELSLLAFVGQDMSGAITAEPADSGLPPGRLVIDHTGAQTAVDAQRLRWSLGGMQLKFSVDRTDRLSLPVNGRGGRWILKIPERSRPDLARAELAAMEWARGTGFDVPALEIVDPGQVAGLPPEASEGIEEALLVRRFDRREDRSAVHMEEFASALGLQPEDKYPEAPSLHRYNFVMLARLVKQVAGPADLREFLRRILFDVLVGNGDGHLKNWAFIFPDGRTPRLAPVFDIVPTLFYGFPAELAVSFTGEKAFRSVDESRLRSFASKLAESPDEMVALARETVERAAASFDMAMKRAGLSEPRVEALRAHWQSLPLARL